MVNPQYFSNRCLCCKSRIHSHINECVDCFSQYLIPITPSACPICQDPYYDSAYSSCYSCFQAKNQGELWIRRSLSIAYYFGVIGELGFTCSTYKGARNIPKRPYMAFPLQCLARKFLSQHMSCIQEACNVEFDLAIPIPGHAELIFNRDRYSGVPVSNCLLDTRPAGQSFSGGAPREFKKNRFKVQDDISGLNVLLLDDVYTHGRTTNSAAYTLVQNGAKSVYAFSVARHITDKAAELLEDIDFDINSCIFCE